MVMWKINCLVFLVILNSRHTNGNFEDLIFENDDDIWNEYKPKSEDSPEQLLETLCRNFNLEFNNQPIDCTSLKAIPKSFTHTIIKRDVKDEELEGSGEEPEAPKEEIPHIQSPIIPVPEVPQNVPEQEIKTNSKVPHGVPETTEATQKTMGVTQKASEVIQGDPETPEVPQKISGVTQRVSEATQGVPETTEVSGTSGVTQRVSEATQGVPETSEVSGTSGVTQRVSEATQGVPETTEVSGTSGVTQRVSEPTQGVPETSGVTQNVSEATQMPLEMSGITEKVPEVKEGSTKVNSEPTETLELEKTVGTNDDSKKGRKITQEDLNNQQSGIAVVDTVGDMEETEKTIGKMNSNESIKSNGTSNEEPKSGESSENSGGKNSNLLITLFVAVLAVGTAAFAYNFIKKRRNRNVRREQNGTTKNADPEEGREMKPLMNAVELKNSVEDK